MNKILSAFICTLALFTFSAQAQAAAIDNWSYNLNIGFVNSDGTLTDEFTWENTSTGSFGPEITTGNITGAGVNTSGSIGSSSNMISQPLTFHHIGTGFLDTRTGTARFTFEIFPEGIENPGQTISFDVNFSAYTDTTSENLGFEIYVPKMDIGEITTSNNSFYYDGYEYDWTLENIFSSHQAAPNFSLTFNEPAPTPEPATMLLMGVGLAGLGFAARRRAKANK